MAGLVENDLAVICHAGPHPLPEERHVLLVQTEETVLAEMGDRSLVVHGARHHIERNACAVAARKGDYLASMEVEERRASQWTYGIRALGAVIAKARSLTSGDKQNTDPSGSQFLFTGRHRTRVRRTLKLRHLRRRRLRRLLRGGRFAAKASLQNRRATRHGLEIYSGDLFQQSLALRRRQFGPVVE